MDPKPAIQPRLASLFEPLSVVGPLFPRPGRAADRFAFVAASDEAPSNARPQSHVDHGPLTGPPEALLPTPSSKIESESGGLTGPETLPPVAAKRQKPVTARVKLAEPEPRLPTEGHTASRAQIVAAAQRSEEGKARIVVPVIGVAVSAETSHRDEPVRPPKISKATESEGLGTLVAHANETRRPTAVARPENNSVEPRNSETLNAIPAADRPPAIKPLGQNDPVDSSLQTLVVPHTTIEEIRAAQGPLPYSTKPEARRDAKPGSAISNIKPHRDSRVRHDDPTDQEPIGFNAQPSINVTIGRVEIRAQLPAESRRPGRHSESPKLMGLDDYLRQRAQGGKG